MSKNILVESLERRMRHSMIRLLEEFDKRFSESDNGNLFKIDIKHTMNDMIRASRDELNDYDIIYKPIKIRPDNTLSMTTQFMESIQRVEFSTVDISFKIIADKTKVKVLDALRKEINAGITFLDDNEKVVYIVAGINDCISSLPFLDRYRFVPSVRAEYVKWRSRLVYLYVRS
jgi:hypothetical protein